MSKEKSKKIVSGATRLLEKYSNKTVEFGFERSWKDYNEFTIIPSVAIIYENDPRLSFMSIIVSAFAWKLCIIVR